jgi:hypothetical protein
MANDLPFDVDANFRDHSRRITDTLGQSYHRVRKATVGSYRILTTPSGRSPLVIYRNPIGSKRGFSDRLSDPHCPYVYSLGWTRAGASAEGVAARSIGGQTGRTRP